MIYIGIDTGGTCTDAVVFDGETGHVLAKHKALTTKDDLACGIVEALDGLPADLVRQAVRVSISTTLATNACVEGKGGRAKLVILGTTDGVLRHIDADELFGFSYEDTLPLDDNNTFDGRIAEDPDWESVIAAQPEFFADAQAFGIAEAYAMRNGGIVEQRSAAYLSKRFGVPAVEASSLVKGLNVMERGATALLNARLMPLTKRFIAAVDRALAAHGIDAPVMIVRSDGSLMIDALAQERPVETILSGPAASVSGARGLANEDECLIIDMGGTTTDISLVVGGHPVMTDGIRIGGWRTQIEGVSISTIGLGGDSRVFIDGGRLNLSPRRVEPICIAASRFPSILPELERLAHNERVIGKPLHEFLYLVHEPADLSHYTPDELHMIELLANGPVGLADPRIDIYTLGTERLEREGVVMRCGLTPTDAMHLKGDYDLYDVHASELAARYFLKNILPYGRPATDEDVAAFADHIYKLVEGKLFAQIVQVFAAHRYPKMFSDGLGTHLSEIVRTEWEHHGEEEDSSFSVQFRTNAKLVGVGAPTHIFLGEVARALGTEAIVPEDADVANAIGAILTDISATVEIEVIPDTGADGVAFGYRVHGTETNEIRDDIEDACALAREEARRAAIAEARRRGALGSLDVTVEENQELGTSSTGAMIDLGRRFVATARTKTLV